MQLWRLVIKELWHRKLNFASGLLSVAIAVGCVAGALALLAAHDERTEAVIMQKEIETREAMRRMEDDYRRIMRDMGYNVLIVHEDQDVTAMQREGVPNTFLPDDYAERLAQGGIKTLNHLLPVLQLQTLWEEKEMEIIVAGVRGQVPIEHRRRARAEAGGGVGPDGTPIMEPVPRGTVNVGHALAERFDIAEGDELPINGATLTVNEVAPRRGAQEDITLWTHLDHVQEWFEREGQINGIFALECVCEADSLGQVIADVHRILPDTQVFEFSTIVRGRALARARAAEAHREAIEAERENRAALRQEREQTAMVLVPLAVVGAAVWVFLLTVANVRERRYEIGILRAVGFSAPRIIGLFQLRVIIMAVLGALAGYIAGVLVGASLGGAALSGAVISTTLSPLMLAMAVVGATVLACVAAWMPALQAAGQDPAEILKEMT